MPNNIQHTENTTAANDKDNVLRDFLSWLEAKLQADAKEAGASGEMLDIGVKSQFAQDWEKFISNPIDSLYSMRQQMDVSLKDFINAAIVSKYLQSKKEIIARALLVETNQKNSLYYCISLKEDTLDNRISVNDFFDFYYEHSLSSNYPVYFQFVPDNLMGNINPKQQIL